jgi:phosphoenolpyruvate-protein phosphotransferase (PTS system enzyme I)
MTTGPVSDVPPSSGTHADLEGIGGSAGFAIGPAFVLDPGRLGVVHRRIKSLQVASEMARFDGAVLKAGLDLRDAIERVSLRAGAASAEASILEAYLLMVSDPTLREEVERGVGINHQCAEWAVESASNDLAARLGVTDDPYLAERSHDFAFVRDRILRALTGQERKMLDPGADPVILVAHDLSPAETATLSKDNVLAIVTEIGTRTSHTSILARALEIPAVVGVRGALSSIASGDMLVVDGIHGRVIVSPDRARLDQLQPQAERYFAMARGLRELRDEPALTKDGVLIDVQANIELAVEAQIALGHGARGVGLYRTEFLYIDRDQPPDEDEQYQAYRRVVEIMAPLPVTLRTFDIGGDKFVTSIRMPHEMNPALGLRAVRLGLERPDLLKTQLRAMVRASAHGRVRIMIPMVASLNETRAVKAMLSESIQEVEARGLAHADHIPLGCMVEVPAAAILADEFARENEFLSIGTNDLVQYTLAVDRSSRELARLASYFDPAVVRLIKGVIQAGNFRKRSVSVCGAMASDPLAALLLLGMGLRSFSMEASAIPEVKAALSRVTLADAEEAVGIAFEATTAHELEQSMAERFGPLLGDLLDPG